jgi:ribosome-associated heat shock protein Hsp15
MSKAERDNGKIRLDKWLWTARFFKTRKLASEAVSGGKIHLNGQRTKPGKEIKLGSQLRIHKGALEWNLEVVAICHYRRPAPEAQALYEEDEASITTRHELTEQMRIIRAAEVSSEPDGRPNKRERRQIHRFKRKQMES